MMAVDEIDEYDNKEKEIYDSINLYSQGNMSEFNHAYDTLQNDLSALRNKKNPNTKQLEDKVEELITYIRNLNRKEKGSRPELIKALDNTHRFLTNDTKMDLQQYQAEAKKLQGKRSSKLIALGSLMVIIGVLAVAAGVILAPAVPIALIGAGLTAVGVGFFAKGALKSGNTAGIAKRMEDVAKSSLDEETNQP